MTLSIAGLIRGTTAVALIALVAACSREAVLPGERLDPRSIFSEGSLPAQPEAPGSAPIALPAAVANAEWGQRAGSAAHRPANVLLSAAPQRVWSANIGKGDGRRHRITADPVVGGGRIYTLDAEAHVAAVSPAGALLWTADMTPPSDRRGDATGGGLAYAEGKVFVTTGFGELVALDAATGNRLWTQSVDTAVSGAPAVSGGTVYVLSRSGSGWAVRAADGKALWQVTGTPSRAGIVGVSAPAVAGTSVFFPFPSGDVIAAGAADGAPAWRATVAGARPGRAYATVSDLTGDPVVADGTVYAGSSAGRLVAVNAATGSRLWQAEEGAVSPAVVAGGSVFIVSDEAALLRLDARTGATIWRNDQPYYVPTRRDKKRRDIYVNYGPVLAGGRLFVASSEGVLRSFDPVNGRLLSETEIPGGGAASAPAVAGGVLYVVSRNGQLHAFR